MIVPSWREQVHFILDEAERLNGGDKLTITAVAASVGKSRISLWRDSEILLRFRQLASLNAQGGKIGPKRRSVDQRVRALTIERDQLRKDNDRLLQTFIVICRRLNEAGIDPVSVLGQVTPTRVNDAWTSAILPWGDQ